MKMLLAKKNIRVYIIIVMILLSAISTENSLGVGGDIEQGLLPGDIELLGKIVEDICFNNAEKYFAMSLD